MARLDQKGGVDIGGNHLMIGAAAGGFAPQEGPAGQCLMDNRRLVVVVILGPDPVADAGQVDAAINAM